MEKKEKKPGFLTGVFKKAVKWATIGLAFSAAGAIGWQFVLDPLFMPAVHAAHVNPNMYALVAFMQDHFGWMHTDVTGFVGDEGGILNWPVVQKILDPYKPDSIFPQGPGEANIPEDFSFDALASELS